MVLSRSRVAGGVLVLCTGLPMLMACNGGAKGPASPLTVEPAVAATTQTPTPTAGALPPSATVGRATAANPSNASTPRPIATTPADPHDDPQVVMLGEKEFPPGYLRNSAYTEHPEERGELASGGALFMRTGQSGGDDKSVLIVVNNVDVFTDTKAAAVGVFGVAAEPANAGGIDLRLDPLTSGPQIGDRSLSFKARGFTQGKQRSGFAIVFRRGRYVATLVQFGSPEPATIDDLAAIARAQDEKFVAMSR